jgi:fructan beta-fructosidase
MKSALLALILAAAPTAAHAQAAPDIVVQDFEGNNYGAWKATGTAFGSGPSRGALGGQMAVAGFAGAGLANSFTGGDEAQGTLSSPPFAVQRRYISFLVGGGGFAGETCVNLLLDGKVVRTATGANTQPGGSENLEKAQWDVSELKGRSVTMEIVDKRSGGWGHITVDNIIQTDTKATGLSGPASRTFTAQTPTLHFPVKNGAMKRRVQVLVDGKLTRFFDIELADGTPGNTPDWWAPLDASAWRGKKIEVRVDKLPDASRALESITQNVPANANLYQEAARAQFHFSAQKGWLNDPNGMVFDGRDYHLFYQYNPYGRAWGNMHWGHAISPDMVHWRELPIALFPHAPGDDVFSGSAVMDKANTSGWKKGAEDVMVAAYTSTGRGECIVYSNDRGRTWTEFEGNPVVKHSGRDPRLLWHEPTKRWVMAVYNEENERPEAERQAITFYTSPDLKQWTYTSRIAGFFECPDIFELPVEGGAPGEKKWVLTAADSNYRIGSFDGKTFTPETPKLTGQRGRDFYAAQTFSHEPKGRRVQIGWFRIETGDKPFNQAMSLPLQLSLRQTPEGPRLAWKPVNELESLRQKSHRVAPLTLRPGAANPLGQISGELLEVHFEFEPSAGSQTVMDIRGVPIRYDAAKQELTVGEHTAPAPLSGGRQSITAYIDRAGIEVFAANGLAYIPIPLIPKPENKSLSLGVVGGDVQVRALEVHELKSAWPTRR